MAAIVRPLPGTFAGERFWLDAARPIPSEDVMAIEVGMDRHAVLISTIST